MRGDWNRAFRNDHTEPAQLPEREALRVAECTVTPRDDLRTWRDVYIGDRRIGMVRVRVGGASECKIELWQEAVYCGDAASLSSKDDRYALAILRLRDMAGA